MLACVSCIKTQTNIYKVVRKWLGNGIDKLCGDHKTRTQQRQHKPRILGLGDVFRMHDKKGKVPIPLLIVDFSDKTV